MIKRLSFLVRKDNMSVADFRAYWLERHAPILQSMPGLRAYSITFLDLEAGRLFPEGSSAPADGFAMMAFANHDEMKTAYASEAGLAAARDLQNFAQSVHRVEIDETVLI